MLTISKSAQSESAMPKLLSPSSRVSGDAGALELSIESAWTRDDFFVAGVELSESQRAEPPTGDLLSAIAAELSFAFSGGKDQLLNYWLIYCDWVKYRSNRMR
jgi:hypothetical protein